MRKRIVYLLLALMGVIGAWAKDYTGTIYLGLGFSPQVGDRIALSCKFESLPLGTKSYISFTEDKLTYDQSRLLSWTPSKCLTNAIYSDYVALNPNAAETDYLIITAVSETKDDVLETTCCITGHFSGFYTKAEMANGLQAAYDGAIVKGITSSQLTSYKNSINNAAIADARAIYDEACEALLFTDTKNAALAEINTMAASAYAGQASLVTTYQGLINSATTRADVATKLAAFKTKFTTLGTAITNALNAIQTRITTEHNADVLVNMPDTYLDNIKAATTVDQANSRRDEGLAYIDAIHTAVTEIRALIADKDASVVTIGEAYISQIYAATTIEQVDTLRVRALAEIEHMQNDPTTLRFTFFGAGMPIETDHYLEDISMTFANGGDDMILHVNDAEVTYPLDSVGELYHAKVTPMVHLHANEDPDNEGKYYTTFYSGLEAYTLPEGVKAYTAEVSENTIFLTPIEGELLPQGEAVLLYTTEGSEITMPVADGTGVGNSENNKFSGVDVETEQGYSTNYMLSYGQDGLGFYRLNEGKMLSANKAFLPAADPAMANVRAFRMVFVEEGMTGGGCATGIENAQVSSHGEAASGTYNILGMRLSEPQKGFNIVNGKKIIVM